MEIPHKLDFYLSAFYRLANGGHQQDYHNPTYNITWKRIKENRDSQWTNSFSIEALPGKTFDKFEQLQEAMRNVEN